MPTNPNPATAPKPARRFFQFGLRTLIVLTLALGVAFGWIGSFLGRVRHQRAIVTKIQAVGGKVHYDYQSPLQPEGRKLDSPGQRPGKGRS